MSGNINPNPSFVLAGVNSYQLRLAFNGPAGWFISTDPIGLPADNIWRVISFLILPANLKDKLLEFNIGNRRPVYY